MLAHDGPRNPVLEQTVLDEADSDPGMRAYVVGPQKAGDPGWAAFYVPVFLGSTRIGTLAALRVRGEPFTRAERRAFVRMANLAALGRAAERYQQQRAELARLQERQRIADDLHDDVAQILFGAQLCLDGALNREDLDSDMEAQLTRARSLLIRGDTAIRTVIHKLSSPPAADIGTRLASVVAGVEDEFAMAVHLEVSDEAASVAKRLRRPESDALVKVAREALVNTAKHAGPCSVGVSLALTRDERLLLTVADDGKGTTLNGGEHHHGLSSLRRAVRDQGGSLRMCRSRAGTRVTASMPVGDRRPVERSGRLAEATASGA
jgi:signal transduction histidine kinase